MGDAIVVEHDEKVYEIALDDLAKYEVTDDDVKAELTAAASAAEEGEDADDSEADDVEGFARMRLRRSTLPRAWIIIRR